MADESGRVTSADGTSIAYERTGDGPPLIIVVGAFNDRSTGGPLAAALRDRFTVYTYDRRGRGDSGDTLPYAADREIEDLAAILAEAGGSAAVFGYSSGAALALQAAAQRHSISRLVLYDLPLMLEEHGPRWSVDHAARLEALIAGGRRGDAVEYFQSELVGIPDAVIAQMRHAPFRPGLEAMAHTTVYEARILGDGLLRPDLMRAVPIPVLAVVGEQTTPFMVATGRAVGQLAAEGESLVLAGQGHDIDPGALAPAIAEFLGAEGRADEKVHC